MALHLAGNSALVVSGTLDASADSSGDNVLVGVMAIPQGANLNFGAGGIQPAMFKTSGSGTVTYHLAVATSGTYDISVHLPPATSSSRLTDPPSQTLALTASTTANFTFKAASRQIHGKVVGGDGNPLSSYNGIWVMAYQPVAGGTSASGAPDSNGVFTLYVATGTYSLNVGGPNLPGTVNQSIVVTTSTDFAVGSATSTITIKLSPPTTYISGTVKDGSGNGIGSADMYAFCANGPGGGHTTTDSQGTYKMYVPPCSNYHVGGFNSSYGQFTEQTNIDASASNPTVNFTISNSDFVSITGTVTKNSAALSGVNVWITQGQYGMGIGGGNTGSDGSFNVKIPTNQSGLYLHAASMYSQGELYDQALANGATISTNTAQSISITSGTVTIHLKPGNTFGNAFIGLHNATSSGFANSPTATSSSYDTYQIEVPQGTYTLDGGIPGFGPLPSISVTLSGATTTVDEDLSSIQYYTVSGTVSADDPSNAFVWAGGSSGGGGGAQTNIDGTFSMTLRAGTYDFGVNKPGYIGSLLARQDISTTTSGLALTLTKSAATITGTVKTSGGSAIQNARVWGDNSSGGWSGDTTDANGAFTLNVSTGTYRIQAVADSYQQSSSQLITAPASSITITLTSSSFVATSTGKSLSQTTGGVVQGTNSSVNIPSGALGSGSNNVQVNITNTNALPSKKGSKTIGTGVDLSASISSSGSTQGQSVTTLSQDATLQLIVSKADLIAAGITSTSSAAKVVIGYDDPTSNAYTQLPTTVVLNSSDGSWANLTSITLSGTTSHFSKFAIVAAVSADPPSTPTGLTATAGNGQVALSWNSSSGATKYNVYRLSGSNYVYLAQTTATSYTNTGLSNGTSYSYEVTALDDNGNESSASSAVSATPVTTVTGTGGGGGGTNFWPAPTPASSPSPTPTPTPTSSPAISTSPTPSATALPPAASVPSAAIPGLTNALFHVSLHSGMRGKDITRLQQLLAQDKTIYPEGLITGFFGPLTEKAVERFQEKYGIAQKGEAGYGLVGPKTRAKLNELAAGAPTTSAAPPTPPASPSGSLGGQAAAPTGSNAELISNLKQQIQTLQDKLAQLLQQQITQLLQQISNLKK